MATDYRIVQVRPQGYAHSDALTELAETVYYGMRRLGVPVYFREAAPADARSIVVGAHLFEAGDVEQLRHDTVIYNSEQIFPASSWLSTPYMQALRNHTVWDYSAENVRRLRTLGVAAAQHVPLGYVPELSRIPPAAEDIDVLFYGSMNPRRQSILEQLRRHGVKVIALFGQYGEERDRAIARAKIVLNVHYYDTRVFEVVRAAYLFANFKAVVAECDAETVIEDDLRPAIRGAPYAGLVDACRDLLRDEEARRALARRGYEIFADRLEESILATALELPAPAPPAGNTAAKTALDMPRTLHLGSGKDFKPDALNIDVNPSWAPDVVLDMAAAQVVGREIDTERFGRICLRADYFDSAIAFDVLEHLPDLVAAMTHCVQLLRPGGRFEIGVPYDLSLGAWQDPTHVRAFNENSWLYFTDWHWYLGWVDMRFDLLSLEFKPSDWGAQLIQSGKSREEVLRSPRAIDYMRVILRKRYLQESERREAVRRLPGAGGRVLASRTASVEERR